MPRDRQPNQPDPERDLLDKLFGAPDEMAVEELDVLYEAIAPAKDAAAIVHGLAADAAVEYRIQNRLPPDHVQAALDATQDVKGLDNLAPSKLRQIVDALATPYTGAVKDPAYAYRNREGELDTHDQGIIDELTDELREDWSGDDGEGKK
jgi:maleate cis-trans isomerase